MLLSPSAPAQPGPGFLVSRSEQLPGTGALPLLPPRVGTQPVGTTIQSGLSKSLWAAGPAGQTAFAPDRKLPYRNTREEAALAA